MQNCRSVKSLCFNVHVCFLFPPHCDDTLVGFSHENHFVRFRKTSRFGRRRGRRSPGFLLKTSGFGITDTGGNCPELSLKKQSVKLQSPTVTPPLCPLPPDVKVRWACNVYMDMSIQFVAMYRFDCFYELLSFHPDVWAAQTCLCVQFTETLTSNIASLTSPRKLFE